MQVFQYEVIYKVEVCRPRTKKCDKINFPVIASTVKLMPASIFALA